MHPARLNTFKAALYTRYSHHKYLLAITGKDFSTNGTCPKKSFPFEIDTVHAALAQNIVVSNGCVSASPAESEKPRYIMMMPVVLPSSQAKLYALVKKFFVESCETADQRGRTTLIVGCNARRGLDSSKLNELYDFYKAWEKCSQCVFLGFVWDPQYIQKFASWKYDIYKTYRILNLIDEAEAARINLEFSQTKVNVPYVNIRERILTAKLTQDAFYKFKNNVTYLGITDPDAVNFNRVIKGADLEISSFKKRIGDYPDMFSPGYEASSQDPEVIQAGIKIDRMIRTETSKVIGMGSYFSETFIIFRVKNSPTDFSFVTQETKKNQNLESRRIFQNGIKAGVIDSKKVVHGGPYPIVTAVMERMKTAYTKENEEMTKENLFTHQALKCMCGLTYNHLSPREWANNLYVALPLRAANIQIVIIPMQEIYKVMHPIYTFYELFGVDVDKEQFDNWLIRFDSYLTSLNTYWGEGNIEYPLQEMDEEIEGFNRFTNFLDVQFEVLNQAWQKLLDEGLEAEWINKIYLAAFNSGSAISLYLYRGRKLIKP